MIIDEAHERDLNIDLLLMLTKELLERNDRIRIIVMSATINAEFFQQYYNNCPLLSIPGFMYNVQTHYIDVSWVMLVFSHLILSLRYYDVRNMFAGSTHERIFWKT